MRGGHGRSFLYRVFGPVPALLRVVLTETSLTECAKRSVQIEQEKYCVANERWVGGLPEVFSVAAPPMLISRS